MARAGFTLIELLVVVAILGLAALGLPRLLGAGSGARLEAAAAELQAAMQLARREARLSAEPVALRLDVVNAAWRDARGQVHRLPEGVAMAVFAPAAARLDDGNVLLRFTPDGGADGGSVTLARGSARVMLELDWVSGRAGWIR